MGFYAEYYIYDSIKVIFLDKAFSLTSLSMHLLVIIKAYEVCSKSLSIIASLMNHQNKGELTQNIHRVNSIDDLS